MIHSLQYFIEKYGFFLLGGFIGAMIHRLRNKMSLIHFIKFLITAVLTALGVGIISRDYFEISETVTYVICGIFGAFSEDILKEIEEFIASLSEIAKKKFGLDMDYKNKSETKTESTDYENSK